MTIPRDSKRGSEEASSGILREIESGMLTKHNHLEDGMRLFKDQSTDLNKAQTGRCAHGKATKLLILPDDKA